ncbi:MAG: ABC transporter ATP-binding protein [Chloroflexota bacterium]
MPFSMQQYWVLYVTYLRPLKRKVLLLALLILATNGLQIVNPQIVRYFIDQATAGEGGGRLWITAVFFIIGAVLLQLVGVAATYVGEDVGWQSTNQLRADLARHCLGLDMQFHHEHTPGVMIERVDGDVADIAVFFAQFVIRILGNLLLLVGIIVVLLWVDWRISLFLLLFATVSLLIMSGLRHIAVPHWKESREANAVLFGFLEEQLAGTEDIRSSGAVGYVLRNLFRLSRSRIAAEIQAALMGFVVFGSWITMGNVGRALSLLVGYFLFREGTLTLGAVYLVVQYMNTILDPLRQIADQLQNLQKATASIERVNELLQVQSGIVDSAGRGRAPTNADDGPLAVQFDDVVFGYQSADPVLKGISFDLEPGEVLGVLGRTGSGKTTITRLLFRLYEVQAGQIRLGDGAESAALPDISLHDLRQRVGMVTQDVQLFQASVRDNLTFFDRTIADDQILQIIRDLGLQDWYNTLSHGLDTVLETEGTSLSAGEGQLLAFTRVFLKNPGLVILDEASSRLDLATERLIERAVDKLLTNRTGIIVAHRLATVARADKILILENGRIREYGRYDELANDPASRFYQLQQTGLAEVLA